MAKPNNVAMIGLGFGSEFIPIYQAHEGTRVLAACRRNETELNKVCDEFGIERRYPSYDEVLANAATSANWTCVGICAHESAIKGGEIVKLPDFTLSR